METTIIKSDKKGRSDRVKESIRDKIMKDLKKLSGDLNGDIQAMLSGKDPKRLPKTIERLVEENYKLSALNEMKDSAIEVIIEKFEHKQINDTNIKYIKAALSKEVIKDKLTIEYLVDRIKDEELLEKCAEEVNKQMAGKDPKDTMELQLKLNKLFEQRRSVDVEKFKEKVEKMLS